MRERLCETNKFGSSCVSFDLILQLNDNEKNIHYCFVYVDLLNKSSEDACDPVISFSSISFLRSSLESLIVQEFEIN